MSIEQKITSIKEQRYAESIKKDLTNKLRLIIKIFGENILGDFTSGFSVDGFGYSSSDLGLNDFEDEDTMPTADPDQAVNVLGRQLDLLNRGTNMQMYYTAEEDTLRVYFDGYLVYRESTGNLECYVPSDKWENKVESYYAAARLQAKEIEAVNVEENKLEKRRQLDTILDYLKKFWGVK